MAAAFRPVGHARVEALLADDAGLLVLGTVIGELGVEHTTLSRLEGGEEVWRREYDAAHGAGRAIAAAPGGGYAVAGDHALGPRAFCGILLRFDRVGEIIRETPLGEGGDTGLTAIATLGDAVIAAGARAGRGWLLDGHHDLMIPGAVELTGLAAIDARMLIATGTRSRSTTALGSALLAGFDADLRERWRHDLPDGGELAAVAALPGGGGLAVGQRADGGGEWCWCLRIGADGAILWERSIAVTGGVHRARAVAPLPDGGAIVAGDIGSGGARHGFAIRLGEDGTSAWESLFQPADEVIRAVAVTGTAIVLGGSTTAAGTGRTEQLVRRLELSSGATQP